MRGGTTRQSHNMHKLLQHFKELTVRPKNAQELKGLILQLAIQGKLTANWRAANPNIETASELLSKINTTQKLITKSKKARKETAKKEFLKVDVNFKIPNTWISRNITEFYYTIGRKSNQIKSKNYKEAGKYPIVSQGKNRIDGYSDDESKLLKLSKPVVVFGDHTRLVKYIDFDFIIGADGTKILNPFDGVDSKYFYLHTSYYDLSSKGYARHYSLLKLEAFCLPPLEEQKEIVKVVETLFKEVEQLEQLTVERIGLKEDFVTSALHQLTTNNANQEWRFLQEHFKSFFNERTNIKRLRETVLQLAVQGKLTADWREQRTLKGAEVEDAAILLKRIQKEKAQLIKDKILKKEKALPPITKDEIPYELPDGWVWCRFFKIINMFLTGPFGSMLHKSDYVENGIPVINPQQLVNGQIIPSAKMQVSEETVKRLSRYVLNQGDIVIARRGEMGRCAIVTENENGFLCGTGSFFLKLNKRIQRQFVYQLFQSELIRDYLTYSSNGVTMSNLNQATLLNMIVPLPPLEEQKVLVQKVNSLMGLCDKLEREVQQSQEHSEQLMKSCLREVFEGEKAEI